MPLTSVTQNPGQSAAIVVAFAAGVVVGANWPKLRESLGPLIGAAGDKLGDVYSAVAQAIGDQKEAMEDSRAERRHRGRSKTAPGAEQDILANLAAALLQGRKRGAAAAKSARSARKRPATRTRRVSVPTVRAASDGRSL
jgi:hypothetical protein